MTSLLMSCKTLQLSRQKTTVIATDTTTITQVAAQDSASVIARVDSIIIVEYNTDAQEGMLLKKKTKIYGTILSSTWLSKNDSLNKKMVHKEKTNKQIKQKTPLLNNAGGNIIFAVIVFVITILVGYLIWKNAVQ